ncbi:transposase, IS4 [Mesorhizobium amorphae CCNWGS0123]|uniref:Transposase, IS4 n=1 Tax=Mesorhizobium amorphae CCNWGS0123 TaxID=1082933 RepID=G6YMB7_9HYPH|nr:transposase, IS4 [Mesorhizobium amorphae CCNWGS0123]
MTDGLRLVPRVGAALSVPDYPRRCNDAGPRASRARGQSHSRRDRQRVGQGSASGNKRVRRRQEDCRPQAPHPVDTDGRLLMVYLTTADISDSAGAQAILDGIRKRWALGEASVRRWRLWPAEAHGQSHLSRLRGRDIRRSEDQKGFQILPRRWAVNRCTMLPSVPLSGRCGSSV